MTSYWALSSDVWCYVSHWRCMKTSYRWSHMTARVNYFHILIFIMVQSLFSARINQGLLFPDWQRVQMEQTIIMHNQQVHSQKGSIKGGSILVAIATCRPDKNSCPFSNMPISAEGPRSKGSWTGSSVPLLSLHLVLAFFVIHLACTLSMVAVTVQVVLSITQ